MMKKLITILFITIAITSCSLFGGGDPGPYIPGKIVFSAKDEAGTSQIFIMKASGTDVKQLTHFDASEGAYQPSWSPDGKQIIFSSFKSGSSIGPALWVMDADGSNPHLLYKAEGSSRALEGNHARWSPDGSQVAFDLCLNCQIRTNNDIYLFDIQSKKVTQVTEDSASDTNPTWSPDGTRIAFVSDRDYVDADTLRFRKDLYVADTDGGNYRLTKNGYLGSYTWINNEIIIYNIYDPNTNIKEMKKLNVKAGGSQSFINNLNVNQFWILTNANQEKFITINKKHQELPVTIDFYSLNGKLFTHIQLNNSLLQTAQYFDWHVSKK